MHFNCIFYCPSECVCDQTGCEIFVSFLFSFFFLLGLHFVPPRQQLINETSRSFSGKDAKHATINEYIQGFCPFLCSMHTPRHLFSPRETVFQIFFSTPSGSPESLSAVLQLIYFVLAVFFLAYVATVRGSSLLSYCRTEKLSFPYHLPLHFPHFVLTCLPSLYGSDVQCNNGTCTE